MQLWSTFFIMLVFLLYLLLLVQTKAITFYFNIQLLRNLVSVNYNFSSGKRIITGRSDVFVIYCIVNGSVIYQITVIR